MTLDFGKSDDEFMLRRHGRLESRQAVATSSAAATSSVAYPAAPSSTPSRWNASTVFGQEWLDTSILPADTSLGKLSANSPKLSVDPQNSDLGPFSHDFSDPSASI